MNDTVAAAEKKSRMDKARRNITYLLLFSIVMFFAGLTSAYLVSKGGSNYWVDFHIPAPFWWSTVIIVASSGTMHMALMQARKDNRKAVGPWLLLTLVLGLAFAFSQFKGWHQLLDDGYALVARLKNLHGQYGKDYTVERRGETLVMHGTEYFLPEDTGFEHALNAEMAETLNGASSYFYVLTYAHFAHIVGGLAALVVMAVQALRGRYGREDHIGLWSGALFWHFLAGLWVYLLLFLAYVH